MTKLFYALAAMLMVLIGVTFPYMNNQQVELRYFGFSGEINLSLLLLCVLVAGAVLGFLGNAWALIKCRAQLARLKRQSKVPTLNSQY